MGLYQQAGDSTAANPSLDGVGSACQHDWHAAAQHDARRLSFGEILKLLRQHVAAFDVGHHQDVSLTRNG